MHVVAAVAYLLAAAVIAAGIFWLGTTVAQALGDLREVWRAAGERFGDALESEPVDLASLRTDLAALERRLTDVDEASDARYRRLSARVRRSIAPDEPELPDELPVGFPQLQLMQPPPGGANGVPMMRPPPKRR